MKFFLPVPHKPEREYQAICEFNKKHMDATISRRRIYELTGVRDKQPFTARVGEPFDRFGEIVVAILFDETQTRYLVCTPSKGALQGEPYLLKSDEIQSYVDFDQQTQQLKSVNAWDWTRTRRIVGGLSAIALLASLFLGKWGLWEGFDPHKTIKAVQAFVLGLWILLPPIWFWIEYYYLYKDEASSGVKLEELKYGQDQSAKIWLALITVLAGLYFGKDLVREAPARSNNPPSSETPGISGNPDL